MSKLSVTRALLATGVFAACVFSASPAQAQFANHSIGFEVGGMWIANPEAQGVGSGGGLGINATLYIESGFEMYFRLLVGLHAPAGLNKSTAVAISPALGFRYLFSEENVRPYLGLAIAYDSFLNIPYDARFTVAPMAGLEFFVADNFSIGVQAEYHLLLQLDKDPEHAVVGLGKFGWYF